jgi:hypothetical protein
MSWIHRTEVKSNGRWKNNKFQVNSLTNIWKWSKEIQLMRILLKKVLLKRVYLQNLRVRDNWSIIIKNMIKLELKVEISNMQNHSWVRFKN